MSGAMREAYNLRNRFGWAKVYREVQTIGKHIWKDTIIYPRTLAVCKREGHDWETDYTLPLCNRCYQMREDIDSKFAKDIAKRRAEELATIGKGL